MHPRRTGDPWRSQRLGKLGLHLVLAQGRRWSSLAGVGGVGAAAVVVYSGRRCGLGGVCLAVAEEGAGGRRREGEEPSIPLPCRGYCFSDSSGLIGNCKGPASVKTIWTMLELS
jgi:hypothetical protein